MNNFQSMWNGNMALPGDNTANNADMLCPNKKSLESHDTLLSMMPAMLREGQYASSNPVPSLFSHPPGSTRTEDITSEVLAELSDDLCIPASDDIFDFEPVPINETSHTHATDKLAFLEDTLNSVLKLETGLSTDVPRSPMHGMQMQTFNSQVMAPQVHSPKRELLPYAPMSMEQQRPVKRQRTESSASFTTDSQVDDDATRRFRPYQAEQWSDKFQELLAFKSQRGHCCVPHTFQENPSLARWVKRQRYQYKLKNEGKPSTMTDERIVQLENVGFVWDSHGSAWIERWTELVQFQQEHGHANVPSNHSSNPQLATWVKCQRRQYKLYWDKKPSNMTADRILRLEKVGFEWELRTSHKSKRGKVQTTA